MTEGNPFYTRPIVIGTKMSGKDILFLRLMMNMNRNGFAMMVGVAPCTVGNWEYEYSNPHPMFHKKLEELWFNLMNNTPFQDQLERLLWRSP